MSKIWLIFPNQNNSGSHVFFIPIHLPRWNPGKRIGMKKICVDLSVLSRICPNSITSSRKHREPRMIRSVKHLNHLRKQKRLKIASNVARNWKVRNQYIPYEVQLLSIFRIFISNSIDLMYTTHLFHQHTEISLGAVIEVMNKSYHQDCFGCNECGQPLVGKCLNVNNNPYCETCGRKAFVASKKAKKPVPPPKPPQEPEEPR